MELKLDTTHICTECGKEIECGLMNVVKHSEICKHNSPNEDIKLHKFIVKSNIIDKRKVKSFEPILKKMTQKEQQELWLLSYNGWNDGETTFMGKAAYGQYYNFRDKMIKKYNKLKR